MKIDDAIDSIADYQFNKLKRKSEESEFKTVQNPETLNSDFVANIKSKG